MSDKPVVLVVEPYSSGPYLIECLRDAGLPVAAVYSRKVPPFARDHVRVEGVRSIDFDGDIDRLVRDLRGSPIRAVLPGSLVGVELADALAVRLTPSLAATPELATARHCKGEMGDALRKAGLPTLPQICTDQIRRAKEWLRESNLEGTPIVIKPARGGLNDGVRFLNGGVGLDDAFADLLGARNLLGGANSRLVIQAHAVGSEYAVDTFSRDGVHSVAGVWRYQKFNTVNRTAVYESMEFVDPAEPDVASVIAYARAALSAVGMHFGLAHVEVMMTAEGPRLIEINPRAHGAGGPRLNALASGDSQVHRAGRVLAGANIPFGYELRKHVRLAFLTGRQSGRLRDCAALDGVAALASHHFSDVRIKTGEVLRAPKTLTDSIGLGTVVLAHACRDQVNADYAALRAFERSLVIEPLDAERPKGQ